MWEMVEALNGAMKGFAPEYVTDPAKAIYRFYRDTRFSADKTPYKDRIAASFPRRGLACEGAAGYYFAVSHKNVGIGGGVYKTSPQTLLAIRGHIAENSKEFRKIIEARGVRSLFGELWGEQLTRVPKGFPKDHPAEALLRYKQFHFYVELPAELVTTPELFVEVRKHFRALAPFQEFLNAPLVKSQNQLTASGGRLRNSGHDGEEE
jgi:uncharacterized protein (TIGR02453 family)